ncbi:MAG TPA: hypothetical protein VMV40_00065 [Acidiferrobacter sp.]|nr:hypothetical protein [Acidiferrobacter sp.]
MPRWLTLGAISLAAVLAGCTPPPSAQRAVVGRCHAGAGWSMAYVSLSPLGALPARHVQALRYWITVTPTIGRRCGSFLLTKHLTLLRGPGSLHITEVRDFYAHGQLIAEHRASVGREIRHSGTYEGRLSLPIPMSTPFGRYRVVSLLYGRWGRRAPFLIARTQATFAIRP